jgi:hypothetical protein
VILDRGGRPERHNRRACPAAGNAGRIRHGNGVVRGALVLGGIGQPAVAPGPGRV